MEASQKILKSASEDFTLQNSLSIWKINSHVQLAEQTKKSPGSKTTE